MALLAIGYLVVKLSTSLCIIPQPALTDCELGAKLGNFQHHALHEV